MAHTLVVVNPLTGKLKDWAEAGRVAKIVLITATSKPNQNLLRIVFFLRSPTKLQAIASHFNAMKWFRRPDAQGIRVPDTG